MEVGNYQRETYFAQLSEIQYKEKFPANTGNIMNVIININSGKDFVESLMF